MCTVPLAKCFRFHFIFNKNERTREKLCNTLCINKVLAKQNKREKKFGKNPRAVFFFLLILWHALCVLFTMRMKADGNNFLGMSIFFSKFQQKYVFLFHMKRVHSKIWLTITRIICNLIIYVILLFSFHFFSRERYILVETLVEKIEKERKNIEMWYKLTFIRSARKIFGFRFIHFLLATIFCYRTSEQPKRVQLKPHAHTLNGVWKIQHPTKTNITDGRR